MAEDEKVMADFRSEILVLRHDDGRVEVRVPNVSEGIWLYPGERLKIRTGVRQAIDPKREHPDG